MTPREYISKFTTICKQYHQSPHKVWRHLSVDDHQALADNLPGEWDCLELCLQLWEQRVILIWDEITPKMPEINCNTCKYFIDLSQWCDKYNKAVPPTFDKRKACKDWNL